MNGLKYKTVEPKLIKKQQEHQTKTQEHKLTKTIEREERKEKRVLIKMEECWMISPLEVWNAPR